uniref:Uncharacterized protein n=1 Tax=Anguilla anguilla TaxID=7936 RepID=A0A0E9P666_ANGAN
MRLPTPPTHPQKFRNVYYITQNPSWLMYDGFVLEVMVCEPRP